MIWGADWIADVQADLCFSVYEHIFHKQMCCGSNELIVMHR